MLYSIMAFNSSCRSIFPFLRRSVSKYQVLHHLQKRIPSRRFNSHLQIKSKQDKYDELRNRLATIPCTHLFSKEVDRVSQDLCYEEDGRLEDVLKWFSEVFRYNTIGDKMTDSSIVLKAFCVYGFKLDDTSWNDWDSIEWRSAILLAWCCELIKAPYSIIDDMLDESALRNGQACWYRRPDVGVHAPNDAWWLLCGVYKLLQKHFSSSKCYANLLHEIFQATRELAYGQYLASQKQSLNEFTFEKYRTVAEYKAKAGVYLPVLLAMHLAGGYSTDEFSLTKMICVDIALYTQFQNDYLDCFGNPETTGKLLGGDIREGTRTWCSVKFLEEASESIKKQFLENYGVDNEDAVAKVLDLYRKANLYERFKDFENQFFIKILDLMESTNDIKMYFFYDLLEQIKKRDR